MKNLYLIPTDKPSRVHLVVDRLEITNEYKSSVCDTELNIYITSDEEIKEGEYQLFNPLGNFDNAKVSKAERLLQNDGRRKKIILTTDQDLIKDGVQAIDDEFLEWLVGNNSCEGVKINQEFNPKNMVYGINTNPYKIIIPKEESKQETIEEAAINRYAAPKNPKNKELMEIYNIRKTSFIDGAKSQAAKEYWFEQFKK
jgi:hypothetical protein